jgi:Methane oxygenase PmoA
MIRLRRRVFVIAALAASLTPGVARAEWVRDSVSVSWKSNGATLWRFSFDPASGKPFFNPIALRGNASFTNFKPEDHPWHYGLWFSWKYINHVNYWEEDRTSGHAAGSTRWSTPVIATRPNGSATISMNVTYSRATGEVDMTESRVLTISAPKADDSFTIDWDMQFTAGKDGAALDRTPMPGEPNGAVNGGYAGLSVRLAPLTMSVVSTEGAVTDFPGSRARPNAAAVAGNFTDGDKQIGGIAILSDPANMGAKAPWYIINQERDKFRFICAAVLAPAVRTLAAGEHWNLRYRVAVQSTPWTQDALVNAMAGWVR